MKRQAKARAAPGFGLAFLDVLCCGLGSAVLLLLIVKHGPADADTTDQAFIDAQTQDVAERLAAAESRRDGLLARLAAQEQELAQNSAAVQALATAQQSQTNRYASLLAQLRSERAALRESAASLQSLQAPEPAVAEPAEVETPTYGRQLTGINVEDDRVAIFLDRSASMLHASLVEIVRLRVSTTALKNRAEKWVSAREAARWAYGQLPDNSRFRLFTYAEDLRDIAGVAVKAQGRISWRTKGDPGANSQAVDTALAQALPNGPTNLKQVFAAAARLSPRPRQVLIITDGYPTLPTVRGDGRLRSLRGCPSPRRGGTPVLSPECRGSVYLDAVKLVGRHLAGVPVDVILYPLDGDAHAVRGYWLLSALSGGRLLTPAKGWPYP